MSPIIQFIAADLGHTVIALRKDGSIHRQERDGSANAPKWVAVSTEGLARVVQVAVVDTGALMVLTVDGKLYRQQTDNRAYGRPVRWEPVELPQ